MELVVNGSIKNIFEKFEDLKDALNQQMNIQAVKLNLNEKKLSDTEIQELIIDIYQQAQLYYLDINFKNCFVQYAGMYYFANCDCQCSNLVYLILSFEKNNFTDDELSQVVEGMKKMKQLTHLSLNISHNKIQGGSLEELGDQLCNFKKLKCLELYLNNMDLQDNGLEVILLGKVGKLNTFYLDVQSNKIGADSLITLDLFLQDNLQLQNFTLLISNTSLSSMPLQSLYQNQNLKRLKIIGNIKFSDWNLLKEDQFSQMDLNRLDELSEKQLNGNEVFYQKKQKNDQADNEHHLEEFSISLSYQNIDQSQLDDLTKDISKMQSLKFLNVSFDCNLNCNSIVKSLHQLPKLLKLNLQIDSYVFEDYDIFTLFAKYIITQPKLYELKIKFPYLPYLQFESMKLFIKSLSNLQDIRNLQFKSFGIKGIQKVDLIRNLTKRLVILKL